MNNDIYMALGRAIAQQLFSDPPENKSALIAAPEGLSTMLGQKVIVRTHSAGVWFGRLVEKDSDEVILEDARRMWKWWAAKSISLSGVAVHGIIQEESKIAPAVNSVWLQAIEIIPASAQCIADLEGAADVEAE